MKVLKRGVTYQIGVEGIAFLRELEKVLDEHVCLWVVVHGA